VRQVGHLPRIMVILAPLLFWDMSGTKLKKTVWGV